ncbi:MAG: hypothetical protein JNL74_03640 [Fibrobacteres bacterium]|nr:hypothetical protein [Fibrobacterota bacterium]
MRKILIDKIEDAMILAKPLVGANGNILLGEGVELKKSMISRFKNWDIPFVYIHSDGDNSEDASSTAAVAVSNDELDGIFSDVIKNPLMKIIYEAARDYNQSKTAPAK